MKGAGRRQWLVVASVAPGPCSFRWWCTRLARGLRRAPISERGARAGDRAFRGSVRDDEDFVGRTPTGRDRDARVQRRPASASASRGNAPGPRPRPAGAGTGSANARPTSRHQASGPARRCLASAIAHLPAVWVVAMGAPLVVVVWLGFSLGGALMNPALGSSVGSRFAEWARQHGRLGIVNWAENEWYSHHHPQWEERSHPARSDARRRWRPLVFSPAPSRPRRNSALRFAAGSWRRPVDAGRPACRRRAGGLRDHPSSRRRSYELRCRRRVDGHQVTSRDPLLGQQDPRGRSLPQHRARANPPPRSRSWRPSTPGFLMSDANGGYYTDGRTKTPLRTGAASFVVYRNGSPDVVAWGSDGCDGPDGGVGAPEPRPLGNNAVPRCPGSTPTTPPVGATFGNAVYVWRSGVGVTADGALVYVGGPGLNITDLANLLVRAGAVRAMELDINTTWVNTRPLTRPPPQGRRRGQTAPSWCPRCREPPPATSRPGGPEISSRCPPTPEAPQYPPRLRSHLRHRRPGGPRPAPRNSRLVREARLRLSDDHRTSGTLHLRHVQSATGRASRAWRRVRRTASTAQE